MGHGRDTQALSAVLQQFECVCPLNNISTCLVQLGTYFLYTCGCCYLLQAVKSKLNC
jgi:hypothetical protein